MMKMDRSHRLKELVYRFSRNRLAVVGVVILCVFALCAIFADQIAPFGFDDQDLLAAKEGPSSEHVFGTDSLGRDIFSRVVFGARISMMIGFISVGIAVLLGGTLGTLAGYFGGWADVIIMRVMDMMMAIPSIILAIAICAALGNGMINTMIAVGINATRTYARILRASIMKIRSADYVEASRTMGASSWYVITRHILINSISPVIVQATTGIATAITTAASLSFIGLGIQPPAPEWGSMISFARRFIRNQPHMVIFPGLAIMFTVLAFNLIGDGLRDAMDSRSSR